ncbi:hypothetical protein [Xenorhabdus sp. SGI246]|uniref:hypothetical protein n=1 Tax=Xenorhabdus sp. SGI246 TaxID=3158263 RepID=UPI00349F705F
MYKAISTTITENYQKTATAELMYWIDREQAAKTAPQEITLLDYMDALAVLPPQDWQCDQRKGSESFKLAEMYFGNVTYIYAKVDGKYFKFRDLCTLSHVQIVSRINAAITLTTK